MTKSIKRRPAQELGKTPRTDFPNDEAARRATAEMLTGGLGQMADAVVDFGRAQWPSVTVLDLARSLNEQAQSVKRGDLSGLEGMLGGQAVALNAIFAELARRAALHMSPNVDTKDRYLGLALRAQAQCRATVEALAEIKNPRPVAFVQQANIAHGPQQVNNGAVPSVACQSEEAKPRAPKTEPEQTELLESSNEQRMDTRAKGKAGGADPQLVPVGEVNGTTQR